jgi:hypothetical protein
MRRRSALLGLVLGIVLTAAAPSVAAWQKAATGQKAAARYGTWGGCTAGSATIPATWVVGDTTSVDDTWGTGHGNDTTIALNGTVGAMRFNALASTVPSGCTVQTASMTLWRSAAASGVTLAARRFTGAWTEATAIGSSSPTFDNTVSDSGSAGGSNDTSFTLNVLNITRNLLSLGGTGYRLTASGGLNFFTSEAVTQRRPVLTVTWA